MKVIKNINWGRIILFYASVLTLTFLARKLPNLLQLFFSNFTDVNLPWNFNHGIALVIVTFIFYKVSKKKSDFSLLGNNKCKSLVFPIILFIGYTIYGIKNEQGINAHLWAFIFCSFTLIYDLMEEYAWRGYLIENLQKINLFIKSIISGVFWAVWHLLIFDNFKQYGGFGVFLLFCIIFSLILTFSVQKTKSILVPATIHALLIRTNIVTLICFIIYAGLLFTWNKKWKKNNYG